jgi:hypothetical protein
MRERLFDGFAGLERGSKIRQRESDPLAAVIEGFARQGRDRDESQP